MKIFVINAKKSSKFIIAFLFALLGIALALTFLPMDTLGVFSSARDLPIYSVGTTEKKAAITFDCAWGAADIPDILSTLEKENVKATFFIVGQWAEKNPETVKTIAEKGHDIGNHSYSHLRMGALDNRRIIKEVSLSGEKLAEISGTKVELFRAPYGDYNNNVVGIARNLGFYTIQWDVDSLDWKLGISQTEIMSRITQKVRPGSIILFHNDTPHTAKLLPSIITTLKKEGYAFEPVSKMIMRENYIIDVEGRQKSNE